MDDARSTYLATQVMTASPQRLRLMLIDAALRSARQAEGAVSPDQPEQFAEGLERARNVVGELLGSIKPEKHPLNDTARALYGFIFRSLMQAQLQHSLPKLQDAIRVLEEERITWEQVCEMEPAAPVSREAAEYELPLSTFDQTSGNSGFSFNA